MTYLHKVPMVKPTIPCLSCMKKIFTNQLIYRQFHQSMQTMNKNLFKRKTKEAKFFPTRLNFSTSMSAVLTKIWHVIVIEAIVTSSLTITISRGRKYSPGEMFSFEYTYYYVTQVNSNTMFKRKHI